MCRSNVTFGVLARVFCPSPSCSFPRFVLLNLIQLLNLMSGEVKRDMKEDNPTDDALTNTYNALKVAVVTCRLFDLL